MHSTYGLIGKMSSSGTAQRLAWAAWGICVSLILAATVLVILDGRDLSRYANVISAGIAFGLFGTVGALIVSHRPGNTIGWILCTVGIGTGMTDFSGSYVAYGMVKGHLPLPGTDLFNWLGNTAWPVNWVLLLVFLPLLFPDGRLLTRRWRIVGGLAGSYREGHFRRFLEFSERQFQSLTVASYYCGPCFTCLTLSPCKGTRAPTDQVVNLWYCHHGGAHSR